MRFTMYFTALSQFAGVPTTIAYSLSESEFGTCTSTEKLPLMCLISAPLTPITYKNAFKAIARRFSGRKTVPSGMDTAVKLVQ